MNTANTVRIAAIFTAVIMSAAVNGATLMMFDHVATGAQVTSAAVTTVALQTVTISAKRV